MRDLILRPAVLAAVACLASACNDYGAERSLVEPLDYSPRYTHVTVLREDGRAKRVLVPEACLAAAEQPENVDAVPPPGCANAYNLQRMAERKRDLTRGRPLGRAPAAPAARAAQQYIDGDGDGRREGPALGGAFREEPPIPQSASVSQQ
jgi:hypothetical protein